jgi:hypothetical protein
MVILTTKESVDKVPNSLLVVLWSDIQHAVSLWIHVGHEFGFSILEKSDDTTHPNG